MNISLDKVLEKGQQLLFLLFPAVLILDPRIAINVFTPLLLLLSLGNVYLNKKVVITFYEKFLIIFISALLISIIFQNVDSNIGMKFLKRHLRWMFYPTLLGQLEIKKKNIRDVFISISIGILGYFYRMCNEFFIVKSWYNVSLKSFFLSSIPWNHRYLFEYDIPQTSLVLGINFITFYYLINIIKNKKNKIFLLIFLIINTVVFLSAQSRGMTLTLMVLIMLLGIVRKEKIFRIGAIALLSLSLILSIYFTNSNYIKRYEHVANDSSFYARVEVYKEAFRVFKENKINGVGFQNFSVVQDTKNYKIIKRYAHPHNMALKMLSETGLIGFFAYYIFMGSILINLLKKYKNNSYYGVGILVLLSLLLYENIETMFINVGALPYVAFILGINLNAFYKKKKVGE